MARPGSPGGLVCTSCVGDSAVQRQGEADDGEQALIAALDLRPDVVLMDLQMPRLNGVEATRRLVTELPDARVLVLTMVEDDDAVFAAIRAGALGYVLKGAKQDEIGRAVRGVAVGEAVYGPSVAKRVRAFFSAGPVTGSAKPFPELTEREREVLDLIASGASNTDIARRLFVSDKTRRSATT
jgi:DNA-binding NarL/FixJ family response regulator